MIDEAARTEFDVVEILHRQMTHKSPETIKPNQAGRPSAGACATNVFGPLGLCFAWADESDQALRHTVYGIDPIAKLGCSALRINSGHYGRRELALAWN